LDPRYSHIMLETMGCWILTPEFSTNLELRSKKSQNSKEWSFIRSVSCVRCCLDRATHLFVINLESRWEGSSCFYQYYRLTSEVKTKDEMKDLDIVHDKMNYCSVLQSFKRLFLKRKRSLFFLLIFVEIIDLLWCHWRLFFFFSFSSGNIICYSYLLFITSFTFSQGFSLSLQFKYSLFLSSFT